MKRKLKDNSLEAYCSAIDRLCSTISKRNSSGNAWMNTANSSAFWPRTKRSARIQLHFCKKTISRNFITRLLTHKALGMCLTIKDFIPAFVHCKKNDSTVPHWKTNEENSHLTHAKGLLKSEITFDRRRTAQCLQCYPTVLLGHFISWQDIKGLSDVLY